jgi:hypothetical protein
MSGKEQPMSKLNPLILLIAVAAGFGFIVAELSILGHTQGPRQTGFIAAIVGAVLGLVAAFVAHPMVRKILAALFAILALSGLLGANAHQGGQARRAAVVAGVQPAPTDGGIRQALGTFGRLPPTLAPLMLTGLALLGAYVSFASSGKKQDS